MLLVHKYEFNDDERRASETILQNVRVLALDQTVDDQNGTPIIAKTATLEVTPKQAELLALAADIGRITLTLRSLAKDEEELRRLVESGEPLAERGPSRSRTYTRDSEASVLSTFSSGGPSVDVSRGSAITKERAK